MQENWGTIEFENEDGCCICDSDGTIMTFAKKDVKMRSLRSFETLQIFFIRNDQVLAVISTETQKLVVLYVFDGARIQDLMVNSCLKHDEDENSEIGNGENSSDTSIKELFEYDPLFSGIQAMFTLEGSYLVLYYENNAKGTESILENEMRSRPEGNSASAFRIFSHQSGMWSEVYQNLKWPEIKPEIKVHLSPFNTGFGMITEAKSDRLKNAYDYKLEISFHMWDLLSNTNSILKLQVDRWCFDWKVRLSPEKRFAAVKKSSNVVSVLEILNKIEIYNFE